MTIEFIGTKWTLDVAVLKNGIVAGYVTDALSAATKAFNDSAYPSSTHLIVPRRVKAKLNQMMRFVK